MKRLFLTLTLFNLVIISSLAQYNRGGYTKPLTTSISGTIVNDANEPVEFASVSLMLLRDSSIVAGVISDSKGAFRFTKLKQGVYSVKIKLLGFKAKIIEPIYLLPKGKGEDSKGKGLIQNFANIKLRDSDVTLDDVDVVAEKSHVQYKLDKKVINVSKDISSSGGSAVDVLENTPSVTVDIDGNVQLRGSTSFTVLIDGKPTVLDASDALEQIPAGAIQNIEIITNPSAKFDPDGAAGIINIVMKKKKKLGLNGLVQLSVGTYDKYKANASFSYRVGKFNLFVGGNYRNEKYYGTAQVDKTIRNDNQLFFSDFTGDRNRIRKGNRLKGGFDYYINEKNTLSISGSYGIRDSKSVGNTNYHDYQTNVYDYYYILSNERGKKGASYDINANYSLKLKEKQKIETSLDYSRKAGDGEEQNSRYNTNDIWQRNNDLPILSRSKDDGPRATLRYKIDFVSPVASNGQLESGYQLRYDNDEEDYTYETFNNASSQWTADTDKQNKTNYKKYIQAMYVSYSNKILSFDYKLGMRAEYMDRKFNQLLNNETFELNRFDLFPSAYLTKKLGKTAQIQMSYSRRVRRPRGRELDPKPNYGNLKSIRKGNPYLKPEYIDSYELNFQKRMNKLFLSVETYYRRANNVIGFSIVPLSADTILLSYDNLNQNNRLGVELNANVRPFKWWNINAYINAYYYKLQGTFSQENVDKESFSWRTRLSSSFSIKRKTKIQFNTFYMAPFKTAQGNIEGLLSSSVAIQHSFLKNKLQVTLKCSDIFDSAKFKLKTDTEKISSYGKFGRRGQIFTLTLAYKINNYRQKRERKDGEREVEGMEVEM